MKKTATGAQSGPVRIDRARLEAFRPVTIEDKPFFDEVFRCNQPEASEMSFSYLYIWRDDYRFSWTVHEDMLLVVSQSKIDIPFALQPLPVDGRMTVQRLESAVRFLAHAFAAEGSRLVFSRMDARALEWFRKLESQCFTFEETPNTADYVYAGEDLRQLAGKRYSAKRNHISQFKRHYPDYELIPVTTENLNRCVEIFDHWCTLNDCQCDQPENCEKYAFLQMIDKWDVLGASGVLVKVGERYEAFTIGERINDRMAVIRFEKGNAEIHGIYAYLGQAYLNEAFPEVEWVNREEDMGVEGLRKSKLSLYPTRMVDKVTVSF